MKKNYSIILWITFLLTLFGELLNVNIIILKLILYFICIVTCEKKEMLVYFIMFNLFSTGILLYIFNLMFGIIYIARCNGKIKISKNTSFYLIIGLFELLHLLLLFFYQLPITTIPEQIMCTMNFIIFSFIFSDDELISSPEKLIKCFVETTIMVALILFLKKLKYYGFDLLFKLPNGIGAIPTDGYYSLVMNANGVSKLMYMALMFTLYLYFNKRINTINVWIGVLICLALGIMTYSLSFVVAVAMSVFLTLFYMRRDIFSKKNIPKLIIALLLLFFLFLLISKTELYQKVYNIFYKSIIADDVSNGRIDIYKYYISMILNRIDVLVFGSGLITYQTILSNGTMELAVHNCFLEVILSWGVIGLMVFLVYIYNLFIKCLKSTKKYTLITLIGILLYMMIGNFFIGYYSSLLLLFLLDISTKPERKCNVYEKNK